MHTKQLTCTECLLNLVLIAQVVFLLECGHTQIHRDATDHPIQALATAGMGYR